MTITISNYTFEGSFSTSGSLKNQSGVYVILTPTSNNNYKILDVGESAKVKERVENHDREGCWKRHANSGGIYYAAHYPTEAQRMKIEKIIRDQYTPPCGKK